MEINNLSGKRAQSSELEIAEREKGQTEFNVNRNTVKFAESMEKAVAELQKHKDEEGVQLVCRFDLTGENPKGEEEYWNLFVYNDEDGLNSSWQHYSDSEDFEDYDIEFHPDFDGLMCALSGDFDTDGLVEFLDPDKFDAIWVEN